MTSISILGTIFLGLAGFGAGYIKASSLKLRLGLLLNFRRVMTAVLAQMLFLRSELQSIYESLKSDPELSFCASLMAEEQRGGQALDSVAELNERDKRLIREFCRDIGMGDISSQQRHAEMIDSELAQRIELLKDELKTKQRLYTSLGVSVGLCVGIILI